MWPVPVHNRTPARRLSPIEPISAPLIARGWWIPDLAFGALRVMAAFLLVRHGLQVHYGLLLDSGVRWLHGPTLYSDAWFAATIALIGGALLGLGVFTRVVALWLAVGVAAVYYVAPVFGWLPPYWTAGSEEGAALYALVLLSIAAIGAGLFSVDALVASFRTRTSWGEVEMSPWVKRQIRHRELTR
jgi:putative oxidoreductase